MQAVPVHKLKMEYFIQYEYKVSRCHNCAYHKMKIRVDLVKEKLV